VKDANPPAVRARPAREKIAADHAETAGRMSRLRRRLLPVAVVFVLLCIAGCAAMITMPGASFVGSLPAATAEETRLATNLRLHVDALATDIGPRHMGRPDALEAAAQYIESQWRALGHSPERRSYTTRQQTVHNLEVVIPGVGKPEEILVLGAHYDSVAECPAANDNASGVAALLETTRLLAGQELRRTVRLVAFVNEEPPFFQTGSMGSRVNAARAAKWGDRIVGMLSLETIGSPGSQSYPWPMSLFYPDRGDFITFVGNLGSRGFVRRAIGSFRGHTSFPSEGAAMPEWITGAGWSDHWSFWQEGYPALMVTDTAPFRYRHYHRRTDTAEKLDYDRMSRVVAGVARTAADLANEREQD